MKINHAQTVYFVFIININLAPGSIKWLRKLYWANAHININNNHIKRVRRSDIVQGPDLLTSIRWIIFLLEFFSYHVNNYYHYLWHITGSYATSTTTTTSNTTYLCCGACGITGSVILMALSFCFFFFFMDLDDFLK